MFRPFLGGALGPQGSPGVPRGPQWSVGARALSTMSMDLADVGRRDLEDIQNLVKKLEFLGIDGRSWECRRHALCFHGNISWEYFVIIYIYCKYLSKMVGFHSHGCLQNGWFISWKIPSRNGGWL